MDKTRTPIGRYRPWYLAGLPVLWLAVYKVFNPPEGVDTTYLFGWYLLLYVAYFLLVLGHSAWAASISRDYHDRSRMFGWMLGIGVFGSSLLQALPLLTSAGSSPPIPRASRRSAGSSWPSRPCWSWSPALSAPEPRAAATKKDGASLKDYFAVFTNRSMQRLLLADLFLVLGPGASAPIYVFFFHGVKLFEPGLVRVL
jgi:Na+/melibiose symporter-like transporter